MMIQSTEITVQGTSMLPLLRAGDVVAIAKEPTYQLGDVVLFSYQDEGLIIHRIVKEDKLRYFCKGDNSYRLELVDYSNILGKAVTVRRGDKTWDLEVMDQMYLKELCDMSLKVHYIALRANWDLEIIRKDKVYLEYESKYLMINNTDIKRLVLQTLRSVYGKEQIDSEDVQSNLLEITNIFHYHDIFELLSDIKSLNEESCIKAKLKRSANQSAHLKRQVLMQPIFNEIDFPYAVIKGVALAKSAYKNESYRGSSDVDLLIDRANLKCLEGLLFKHGFIQGRLNDEGEIVEYTREERVFYLTTTHQAAPFIKPTGDRRMPFLCVDVNLSLTWGEYDGSPICINEFLTDTVWFPYGETEEGGFYTLPAEKLMIQYCLHNYKEMNSIYLLSTHNSISLRSFCDVYGLIKQRHLDLHKVAQLAQEYSVQKYVCYVLYFTALVFDDKEILRYFDEEYFKSPEELNQFGLAEDERKSWPVSFEERLFSQNRYGLIRPLISQKELEKIRINQRFL